MKNLVIFILSLFVYSPVFAQDTMEKRYFENRPEIVGDVQIKSSSVKVEKDEIFKTFEVESPEEGVYYMDAWIVAPLTKEGYPEYKVAVNGVLSEFTFKPQSDGWQSLPLTDAKKSVIAISLKKGKNNISIIAKSPEIPNIEIIKLSSDIKKTGIPDANYKKLLESIKSNTLRAENNTNAAQAASASLLTTAGTNNEIYDYYLNTAARYTTYQTVYLSAGDRINITADSPPFFAYSVEIFSLTDPVSCLDPDYFMNGWCIAPVTGIYFILVRAINLYGPGWIHLGIHTYTQYSIVHEHHYTYQYSMVNYLPQFPVTGGYYTPAYFYTCKIKNDGDTWLLLADNSDQIRAFNDDGGTTTDGYSWGSASRIKTNVTDISYALLLASSSILINSNEFECDLYMGLTSPKGSPLLAHSWDAHLNDYPLLSEDNSFLSGRANSGNCFAWSIGDTTTVFWFDTLGQYDIFYNDRGYTRDGATADNAAIALWVNQGAITHASVRKNSTIPNPHGFEWESKLGSGWCRVMHIKDALVNNGTTSVNYNGSIGYYYRPMNGTVNYSPPVSSKILESSFSAPELNRITILKNNIPATVLSDFDTKYLAWKKTWNRPEIAIHSNPFMYAQSSEYESLLEYCMKYGKAIWPLVFDRLAQKDIFVISLLRDLTYNGKPNFITEMISVTVKTGEPLPTVYAMQVNYCKGLLAKEDENIVKSIRNISALKEEPFEVTVTLANSREIQLSLQTEKDEKAQIRIHNFSGGLEFEASYNLSKGNQTLVINTSNLKKGIYVVQITIGSESISKTVSI